MAITEETIKIGDRARIALDATVDAATADQVRAWARAWRVLETSWQDAITDVIAMAEARPGSPDDLDWPSRAKILRARRVAQALENTRAALEVLVEQSTATITGTLPRLVTDATSAHAAMIASQMPEQAGTQAALTNAFNRVDPRQLAAIVQRTTQQVTALHYYLGPAATEAMKEALVRGVALGQNPRTAAREMLRTTRGSFDGGLVRANVIARTEMLDAHRGAQKAAELATADTLAGWIWSATLDATTCPSCWAQHGTLHAITEDGPNDHQQGRCTRRPKTKTWAELGFTGIEEPADVGSDARTVFSGLPEADQLAVMGPARLALLRSGQVRWEDLSVERQTPGWRPSFVPTPVSRLKRATPVS